VDTKRIKKSGNLVDLTRFDGFAIERLNMLNNFLNAQLLNRKSLENQDYWSDLGSLPKGKKYPFRPVDGPNGNVLMDLLTNPEYLRDQRYSDPLPGGIYDLDGKATRTPVRNRKK
jgi:hypothetical protein